MKPTNFFRAYDSKALASMRCITLVKHDTKSIFGSKYFLSNWETETGQQSSKSCLVLRNYTRVADRTEGLMGVV